MESASSCTSSATGAAQLQLLLQSPPSSPSPPSPARRASLFASLRALTPASPLSAESPAAPADSLLSRASQLFARRSTSPTAPADGLLSRASLLFARRPAPPPADPTPMRAVVSPPARYARDAGDALKKSPSTLQTRSSAWVRLGLPAAPYPRRTGSAEAALREWHHLIRLPCLRTVERRADEHAFSAPAFRLTPYGRNGLCDSITLYTNAVRAETRTLFFLLHCLHERATALQPGDLQSLLIWLEPYARFVHAVVALLQRAWLPRLHNCAALPPHAPLHFFSDAAARLQRTLTKLLSHRKSLLRAAPRAAPRKLLQLLTPYAALLLDYCARLEAASAALISATFSAQETRLLTQQLIAEFKSERHFDTNLVRLLRWLSARPKTASYWRRDYLDAVSAMRYTQWKKDIKQQEVLAYFAHKAHAHPRDRYYDDPALPFF